MEHLDNVGQWLGRVPADVAEKTLVLLGQLTEMRRHEVIYPEQDDVMNALAYTGPDDVRAVIIGQDPYHGPGQAMGLAFSVRKGVKLPPSLRNVYKELASDLSCPMPESGDLTPWAEQGVLLLNTSLTVKEGSPNSHADLGWSLLTDAVVAECLRLPQPVVFLAWGRPAISLVERQMAEAGGVHDKFVLKSTHPSPLSARRASADLPAFIGSHPFSRANRLLEEHGSAAIDWCRL